MLNVFCNGKHRKICENKDSNRNIFFFTFFFPLLSVSYLEIVSIDSIRFYGCCLFCVTPMGKIKLF